MVWVVSIAGLGRGSRSCVVRLSTSPGNPLTQLESGSCPCGVSRPTNSEKVGSQFLSLRQPQRGQFSLHPDSFWRRSTPCRNLADSRFDSRPAVRRSRRSFKCPGYSSRRPSPARPAKLTLKFSFQARVVSRDLKDGRNWTCVGRAEIMSCY